MLSLVADPWIVVILITDYGGKVYGPMLFTSYIEKKQVPHLIPWSEIISRSVDNF